MNATLKTLDSTREHIAALEAQLLEPIHAQASREEVRSMLSAQIDAWHDHASERLSNDLQRMAAGASVDLLAPEDHGFALEPSYALIAQVQDARAWLTFAIGKKEILARFRPLLDNVPEGVDAATRADLAVVIQRQIVDAEVLEESLIRQAEAEGIEVDPRRGQRPEAAIVIGWGE